jgi:hypothetical protein
LKLLRRHWGLAAPAGAASWFFDSRAPRISLPLFENDVGVHANTLVMPGLDPDIHPSS